MTARNFGIASGRQTPSGASTPPAALRASTLRDLYPLPHGSLSPPMTDTERSNIAGRFAVVVISACFLIPMILAGIMMHFR